MLYLVIYDIECDKIRGKVANACANFGMERLQYSAFWGDLSDNRCEELVLRCQELMGEEPGRLHVFPICRQCFERRIYYATEPYKAASGEAPMRGRSQIIFPRQPGGRDAPQGK